MFVNVFSVGALTFGSNGSHAMVLDTIHEITENNQSLGYAVGDFKMVFKNTFDDEENRQPRQVTMNAKSTDAPDFFYFVHIQVNLDAVKDCSCKSSDRFCTCR